MCSEFRDTDQPEVIDAIFRVLSDTHRRLALYYILDQETTTIEKLATVLTGWMQAREDDVAIATPDDRKQVRIALRHVHLPTLEDEEFIRYDAESGEVTLGSVPELLETIVQRSLADERRVRDGNGFGDDGFRTSDDNFDGNDDGFGDDDFGSDRGYSGNE